MGGVGVVHSNQSVVIRLMLGKLAGFMYSTVFDYAENNGRRIWFHRIISSFFLDAS